MRILFSIMVFHPVVGGTEISAQELARSLAAQGHDVEIVTLRVRGMPGDERVAGVPVYRHLLGIGRSVVFAASYALSLAWFLLRRRGRYDVIQVYYGYLDAVVAALLRPVLGVKAVVVRLGGGGPAGDLERLRRLRMAWWVAPLIKRLDRFIVMSEEMRAEWCEAGVDPSNIALIHNGIDTETYAPVPSDSAPRFAAVSVARLSPEKGLDVLLQAWSRVVERLPEARLCLVGDGPQRADLERHAQSRGLDGSVTFSGSVPDVRPFLRASEAFVLSSRSEGMPNALLQAMAMGLPCIATRVGAVSQVIQDRLNGRLVPSNDPDELARALCALLGDPDQARRLGGEARKTIEGAYSLQRMVDRYLAEYQKLVSR